ncbi:MAG: hypothetical protein AAB599_02970, partial [Patescibacteria group bacterium]
MAARFFNPFSFLDDIRHRVRRTLFTPQNHGIPTPPPIEPVDKEQPGVIYRAQASGGQKVGTPVGQSIGEPEGQIASGPAEQEANEPEDQISFIPISRGRVVPPSLSEQPTPQGGVQTIDRLKQSSAEHILLIASRPKSFINLFLDEIQKLAAEIPILKLVVGKPRNQEEMVAQAIQRYVAEYPSSVNSQEVQDLKANTQGISQEIVATTGQVKSVRIIPEERIEGELQKPLYQQRQESFLPVQIQPGRLIRFLPQETFERLITSRFSPAFSRIATSAAKDVVSRGAIVGRGLVSAALRGAGGWVGKGAITVGSRLAFLGLGATSWAW